MKNSQILTFSNMDLGDNISDAALKIVQYGYCVKNSYKLCEVQSCYEREKKFVFVLVMGMLFYHGIAMCIFIL